MVFFFISPVSYSIYAFVSCVLIFSALLRRCRSLGKSWRVLLLLPHFHFFSFPFVLLVISSEFRGSLWMFVFVFCARIWHLSPFSVLCVRESVLCVYRCFFFLPIFFAFECSLFVWMDFIWIFSKCLELNAYRLVNWI